MAGSSTTRNVAQNAIFDVTGMMTQTDVISGLDKYNGPCSGNEKHILTAILKFV